VGRRAALRGLASIAIASATTNLLGKRDAQAPAHQRGPAGAPPVAGAAQHVVSLWPRRVGGCLRHRRAVAARLGVAPVTFPGDHGGFMGGEYGQAGEPDAFAATLREVLNG
jgi:hypothetical protein